MRIDERLNLVIPLFDGEHVAGYVHSIPISRAAFEANWRLVSLTFSGIFSSGLGEVSGPRVAALLMKELAAKWDLDADALVQEIQRLSCFIHPTQDGWESLPLPDAIKTKMISVDDQAEVLNALVFFTVVSAMWPRQRTADLMPGVAKLWSADTSSLTPSGWIDSLTISTGTAASGVMASPAMSAPPVEIVGVPNRKHQTRVRIST